MKINKIKYINFNRSHVKIQYIELFELIICFLEKHLYYGIKKIPKDDL